MSPEDLELVRRAYAMFAARNVDALLDGFVAPDVEWSTTPGVPFERTYHGVGEMRRAMADWMGQFDDFTTVVEHIADAGEHALVCHRMQGRGRDSGIEVDQAIWQVVTVRDGKIVRMRDHWTCEEALAAAGQLQG